MKSPNDLKYIYGIYGNNMPPVLSKLDRFILRICFLWKRAFRPHIGEIKTNWDRYESEGLSITPEGKLMYEKKNTGEFCFPYGIGDFRGRMSRFLYNHDPQTATLFFITRAWYSNPKNRNDEKD
jgi:hypothetical protein